MSVSDIKISELTVASTSTNSDVLPVVQNNETKQMTKSTLLADVNTSITNIKNGTNINDFAGVESALDGIEQEQTTQNSNINSNTTAINGIRNGSTINSFAGVESALNTKVDKVAGKGLSTNDFDNTQKAQIQTNKDNILLRSLITETGNKIGLEINNTTYVLTAKLYDKNNNLISTSTGIDLPLETMVVGASYDSATKEIVLTLKNGSTVRFSVADLVSGLQSEITVNNKLASDLVDDTNQTNKFVTASEKAQITTNATAISGIKDGTTIDSFSDVETALNTKVDKVTGKGLSTNDFDNAYKTKLDGIEAEANKTIVDSALSSTSTNPVQNKTINTAINDVEASLEQENISLINTISQIVDTQTKEGTSLSYTDTIEARFKSIILKGNKIQDGTPSPTSPQDVKVVTGENKIIIDGKRKNILPFYNQNFTISNLNFYIQNGSLYLNGKNTNEILTTNDNFKNNFDFYLDAGTYVISGATDTPHSIKKYDNDSNVTTTNTSFTLTEKTHLYLGFYIIANTNFSNLNLNIQLESGSTATPYEPHEGATYNVTLGTLQLSNDSIIEGTIDNWKIKNNYEKLVLNGSEAWALYGEASDTYIRFSLNLSKQYITNVGFSNLFVEDENKVYNKNGDAFWIYQNSLRVCISKTIVTSLQEFTNLLSETNFVCYLMTSAETTITDETLNNQLNAIARAKSYEGTTYINSTHEENNAPLIISATALKNTLQDDTAEKDYEDLMNVIAQIVPTETDEDSEITFANTLDARLKSIVEKGNTLQNSYTGKNKCINAFFYNANSIHFTVNPHTFEKTFTLSFIPNITVNDLQLFIGSTGLTSNNQNLVAGTRYSITRTLSDEQYADVQASTQQTIDLSLYKSNAGMDTTSTIGEPQIEFGETATSFEPYCGGTASPNPDFPQSVRVVTGENRIEIDNGNIFNGAMELGSINGATGVNDSSTSVIRTVDYIDVHSYRNRNISIQTSNNSTQTKGVRLYNANHQYLGSYSYLNNSIINLDTITISNQTSYYVSNADIYYMKFVVTTSNDLTIKYGVMNNTTTYLPYQAPQNLQLSLGNIELCKIGDYQDYITGTVDNWKVVKNVHKVAFKDLTFSINAEFTNVVRVPARLPLASKDVPNGLCNSLIFEAQYSTDREHFYFQSTSLWAFIEKSRLNAVTDEGINNYFSTQNIVGYYIRLLPLETPITDSTLIEQLNSIYNARSYANETNITVTCEDGNAPMIISATALKQLT